MKVSIQQYFAEHNIRERVINTECFKHHAYLHSSLCNQFQLHQFSIDILCLLLEAISEYCVLRNFFLTPLGDQHHTSLQLGSITTSLFLFQCHSPPLLTTTLGTQWAMWISAAGGAGKGKTRCQCSVQFLNRSCW